MKKLLLLSTLGLLTLVGLDGCNIIPITRTETDIYTITHRDTTIREIVKNAPGARDNGVVYPSSRTIEISREVVQHDSIVERKYPDFIRLGLFEGVGLIGTSNQENALGPGMFGVFGVFDRDFNESSPGRSKFFTGGIYRFGIGEWRLRWFDDAENWTVGTHALELIPTSQTGTELLASVAPLYIRKRFFFKETIPYLAVTPAVGLGLFPSQYINASVSADFGSIGGLNVRAYLGMVLGQNPAGLIINTTPNAVSTVTPYGGLGVSVLDFLNLVAETEKEWKYHEHSAWNIGIAQIYGAVTFEDSSLFGGENSTFNGAVIRLANASVAIPILNNRLYVGTSLINFVGLGGNKWGLGFLPIRVGYWIPLLKDDLALDPFAEYNFYPSSFVNVGARLALQLSEFMTVNGIAGFCAGSTIQNISRDLISRFGPATDFSGAYFGIGIGISDRMFRTSDIRYNRGGK